MSFAPMPAASYAPAAARETAFGLSGSAYPDTRTDVGTQIGLDMPRRAAVAREQRTTAAAPSPIDEHIGRVSGSLITRLANTSSTVVSLRNCAYGFRAPAWRLFTVMCAKSAAVAPVASLSLRVFA